MPFTVPADDYDRFMGRYVPTLAAALCDAVRIRPGIQALDVGCGPGGLTRELVARVGAADVAAIDPAPQFVAACRQRNPGVDARVGVAEALPWPDDTFDAVLSCLVIGFMTDPDGGVREMSRVTRPGGMVAACMWDIASGGMTMLSTFWNAVHQVCPDAQGERGMVGTAEGDIARLLRDMGLVDIGGGALTAYADYDDFDDYWDPFMLRVGPAGQFLASLGSEEQQEVREACREALPVGEFRLEARAWFAHGVKPNGAARM